MDSPTIEVQTKIHNEDLKISNPWEYYLNLIIAQKTPQESPFLGLKQEDVEKIPAIVDLIKNQQNMKEIFSQSQSRLDAAESLLNNIKKLAEETASVSTTEDLKYRKNIDILNQQLGDFVESFDIFQHQYKTQLAALQTKFEKYSSDIEIKLLEKFKDFLDKTTSLELNLNKNTTNIESNVGDIKNLEEQTEILTKNVDLKFEDNLQIQNKKLQDLKTFVVDENNTIKQNFQKNIENSIDDKNIEYQRVFGDLNNAIKTNFDLIDPINKEIDRKLDVNLFQNYKDDTLNKITQNNSLIQTNVRNIEEIQNNLLDFVKTQEFKNTTDTLNQISNKIPEITKNVNDFEVFKKTSLEKIESFNISKDSKIKDIEDSSNKKIETITLKIDNQYSKISNDISNILKNYEEKEIVDEKLKAVQLKIDGNTLKIDKNNTRLISGEEKLSALKTKLDSVDLSTTESINEMKSEINNNKIKNFDEKLDDILTKSKTHTDSQIATRVLTTDFNEFKSLNEPIINKNTKLIGEFKKKQDELYSSLENKANSDQIVGIITTVNTKLDKTVFESDNLQIKKSIQELEKDAKTKIDKETFESYKSSNKNEISFLVKAIGDKPLTSEINVKLLNISNSVLKKIDQKKFTDEMEIVGKNIDNVSENVKAVDTAAKEFKSNITTKITKLEEDFKDETEKNTKSQLKIKEMDSELNTSKSLININKSNILRTNKRNNARFLSLENKTRSIPLQVNLFQIGIFTKPEQDSSMKFIFVAMFSGVLEKIFTSFRDPDGVIGAQEFNVEIFKDVGYPLNVKIKHEEIFKLETPITMTENETLRFVFKFNIRPESNYSFLLKNLNLGFRVNDSLIKQPQNELIEVVPLGE